MPILYSNVPYAFSASKSLTDYAVSEPEIISLHRCVCLLEYLGLSHGSLVRRERYLDARVHCLDEDLEVTEEDIHL